MGKQRKVYLPRWIAWFIQLFVLPIWLWTTYAAFFTEKGRDELGIAGWLVVTLVMAAVSVMVFLMSYGKWPAYIIEEEDE
ncbi:MAG: hypothetical protein HYY26_05085 [Acidobacteria bacterium]|nr:hypothetical protein [Acidobacteriota bacterium]